MKRRTDKERMNYLSSLPNTGDCVIVATGDTMVTIHLEGKTLRKAIDAAMTAEEKEAKKP